MRKKDVDAFHILVGPNNQVFLSDCGLLYSRHLTLERVTDNAKVTWYTGVGDTKPNQSCDLSFLLFCFGKN